MTPVKSGGERSWGSTLLWTWGLVAALLVIRVVASHVSLARLARRSQMRSPLHEGVWTDLVEDARAHLGITRAVAVCRAESISVPAVTGLWRPMLLLPLDADDWTPDVQRAVVLHELAHVARWDAMGQFVSPDIPRRSRRSWRWPILAVFAIVLWPFLIRRHVVGGCIQGY